MIQKGFSLSVDNEEPFPDNKVNTMSKNTILGARQSMIMEMLQKDHEIPVNSLASHFNVSPMTIRRDLHLLEKSGLLIHQYGKAVLVQDNQKNGITPEIKLCRNKIARYAASLVEDGDVLFLNGSSTALMMLDYIQASGVSIYTNNIRSIDHTYPSNLTINLTGGEIRDHVMVGEYVMKNLLNLHADKTFLGCGALYTNGEFRYDIPTEIGINEAMIARTKKKIYVLADHQKIHPHNMHDLAVQYGSLTYETDISVITDDKVPPDTIEQLKQAGLHIITVS